jgi:YesN/AraC family two-component response regulator
MNQSLSYHRHNAYEIYLFLSGNTNMYVEQTCYSLRRGDLIIISPEEFHRMVCLDTSPYERIGINIQKTVIERLSTQHSRLLSCFENHSYGENNLVHLSNEDLTYYTTLVSNLNNVLHSSSYGDDILRDTYLAQILVFINHLFHSERNIPNNIMPTLVRDTMVYIREHITENISLDDLSKYFNFNGAYISSKFKYHTGLTLRTYILDQRIMLSKRLLMDGRNVQEACELAGFANYSNFIRSFTKIVGISPGKYKKNLF